MNIQTIINGTFKVPHGTRIVRYSEDPMCGPRFGEVGTSTEGVAPGQKLVTAIAVASRLVADLQAAIDAMQACLDAGPVPVTTNDEAAR